MKNTLQALGFCIEVFLFVFSGFFIALGITTGYILLILGFIMAVATGNRIKIDAIKEWRLKNGCK